MKIRLSISDEGGLLISRYYIRGINKIQDVLDALTVPLKLEQKLVLVDALKVDKDSRYIRGMYGYNQQVIKYGIDNDKFDLLVVNKETMPTADYHIGVSIRNQKLFMVILKMEHKGGTPLYSGNFREFSIDKVLEQYQYLWDE